MKTSIKQYSIEALERSLVEQGFPAFRARQIFDWLYLHHATTFDEMSNLPLNMRELLNQNFLIGNASVIDKQTSKDGTRKYLICFEDGVCVETVAIPSLDGSRLTVCFSTQAGCSMDCSFCATGKEGLARSLLPGEIVDQVLIAQEDMGRRVSNVVGMGQGEPFLNYDNVLAALRIMNNKRSLGIGARHISISTCGVVPGIIKFADEPEQFTLAISLHSAVQEVRQCLMPKTEKYPLDRLRSALVEYTKKTNRRVTLEYIMIKDITDTPNQLDALCNYCSNLLCHVNLIPINSISASPYRPSEDQTINLWLKQIKQSGTEASLRHSKGADISGACGQLKNTQKNQ